MGSKVIRGPKHKTTEAEQRRFREGDAFVRCMGTKDYRETVAKRKSKRK